MMHPFRKVWKKLLVLFIAGVALFFLFSRSVKGRGAYFVSDLFFAVSSVYLCAGLVIWIKNLGMFNTLKYGFKQLVNVIRGRREPAQDRMAGGYLEYVKSRPVLLDAPWMFLCFGVFLALSVLVSFF